MSSSICLTDTGYHCILLPHHNDFFMTDRPTRERQDPRVRKQRVYDVISGSCNIRINNKVQPAQPKSKAGKVSLPLSPESHWTYH